MHLEGSNISFFKTRRIGKPPDIKGGATSKRRDRSAQESVKIIPTVNGISKLTPYATGPVMPKPATRASLTRQISAVLTIPLRWLSERPGRARSGMGAISGMSGEVQRSADSASSSSIRRRPGGKTPPTGQSLCPHWWREKGLGGGTGGAWTSKGR